MNQLIKEYISNPFFLNIAEQLSEYLYVVDEKGYIVFINRAAEKFEQWSSREIIGKHINEIYKQDVSPTLKALETKAPVPDHENIYMIGGKEFRQLAKSFPVFSGDKLIGAVTLQHDVTILNQMLEDNLDYQKKMSAFGYPKKRTFSSLIGRDPSFLKCVELAKAASGNTSSVLLSGYTGSGKEMFARSIHNESARRDKPFLAINCAAIPEGLLESLLFGTTKGSFTGAVDKAGLFEQAQGGTLFLDEINSMPLASQAKLLRVLEEKELRRVGGSEEIKTDVRIISSINVMPSEVISRRQLREDLFYRLSVITITIPPLAGRNQDIDLITDFFIKKFSLKIDKPIRPLAPDAYEFFHTYSWPGNIRQLKHVIESAINISDPTASEILLSDLPQYLFEESGKTVSQPNGGPDYTGISSEKFSFSPPSGTASSQISDDTEGGHVAPVLTTDVSLDQVFDVIRENEKKEIINALMTSGGNIAKAARLLDMNRQTLVYRMKKYGIVKQKG